MIGDLVRRAVSRFRFWGTDGCKRERPVHPFRSGESDGLGSSLRHTRGPGLGNHELVDSALRAILDEPSQEARAARIFALAKYKPATVLPFLVSAVTGSPYTKGVSGHELCDRCQDAAKDVLVDLVPRLEETDLAKLSCLLTRYLDSGRDNTIGKSESRRLAVIDILVELAPKDGSKVTEEYLVSLVNNPATTVSEVIAISAYGSDPVTQAVTNRRVASMDRRALRKSGTGSGWG